MNTISLYSNSGLSEAEINSAILNFVSQLNYSPSKVLIIPPDITRLHSYAGKLTEQLWKYFSPNCDVDILPALGTHDVMTEDQFKRFFGSVPYNKMLIHSWRNSVVNIGTVPGAYVNTVSEGIMTDDIPVEVNENIVSGKYDLMISLGQVVPHEVVGMANWSKNIFVGCGGREMINKSHVLGALYGLERIMGHRDTPVRKVFDYAHEHYLSSLPLYFFQTVTTSDVNGVKLHGLFIGNHRDCYEKACDLALTKNMIFVDKPFQKTVVYLDPAEFHSTWLGNKAIYRTRMAMATDGNLIILAPGVLKFGEDLENDKLIRKYGYIGREKILDLYKSEKLLQENQSVTAHLVHGSSDGRFNIQYCTKHLSENEVKSVGFDWMDYDEAIKIYDPNKLHDGYNTLDSGEEIFYISNPALGLWADKKKFD